MTNNDEMAMKLGNLAVKATGGEWSAFVDVRSKTFAIHTPEDNTCSDIIKWAGFDGQKKAKANAEFIATASPANILALLAERDADKKRIAELEAAASCKFMPVGVMSQSKFESLDNGDVRFIALWPRPCVPVRRKRPDDGVLVYAKVAGINLEVGE